MKPGSLGLHHNVFFVGGFLIGRALLSTAKMGQDDWVGVGRSRQEVGKRSGQVPQLGE